VPSASLFDQPDTMSSVFKYVVTYPSGAYTKLSFADERDTDFVDWASTSTSGGEDYTSYFTTGYQVHGAAVKKWQPAYICLYSKADATELTFKALWDYNNTDKNGRWSQERQFLFNNSGKDYSMKRLKTRGKGRACQFHVSSVPGKPLTLAGWALYETGSGTV
jgi:hypothetical protein